MPQYNYTAIDEAGRKHRGSINASNEMDLEMRVSKLRLDLIDFRVSSSRRLRLGRKKGLKKQLLHFTFSLHQMLKSGVSVINALEDIRESLPASAPFRDIMGGLIDSIHSGSTLSQALGEHPDAFDRIYVSLIEVGEQTGKLDELLEHMLESLRWQDELSSHAKKIMIYPSILGVVILSVVTFLMVYLVPKLVPFITEFGGDIPLQTRALIATSAFLSEHWILVLATAIATGMFLRFGSYIVPGMRRVMDTVALRFWLFGPLNLKIKLARLTNSLAIMYQAGLPVLDSLKLSRNLLGNSVLEAQMDIVMRNIADGTGIAQSFRDTNFFPPLVIRMFKVGEATGSLDESLNNVNYFYNRDIRETIERIEPAITPALTIIMAVILGWVMMSVLGPIYDTISNME